MAIAQQQIVPPRLRRQAGLGQPLSVRIRKLGLALVGALVLCAPGDHWAFRPIETVQAQTRPLAASPSPVSEFYGIDFSPYLNGQDPNLGSQITTSQIQIGRASCRERV